MNIEQTKWSIKTCNGVGVCRKYEEAESVNYWFEQKIIFRFGDDKISLFAKIHGFVLSFDYSTNLLSIRNWSHDNILIVVKTLNMQWTQIKKFLEQYVINIVIKTARKHQNILREWEKENFQII